MFSRIKVIYSHKNDHDKKKQPILQQRFQFQPKLTTMLCTVIVSVENRSLISLLFIYIKHQPAPNTDVKFSFLEFSDPLD